MTADRRATAAALLDVARAEARRGSLERAWRASAEAAAIGRALGDATIVAGAATAIAGPQLAAWQLTASRQALCLEALSMIGEGDPALKSRVSAHLAGLSTAWSASPPTVGERISRAEAENRFTALQAQHAAAVGPSGVGERLAIASRLQMLGSAASDDDILAWAHLWRLDALEQLGLRVEFSATLVELGAVVARLDSAMWTWRFAGIRAALALLEDRLADVPALIAETRHAGIAAGTGEAPFIDLVMRSALAGRTGEGLADIEVEVRHAVAEAPFLAQGWRALLLLQIGRIEEAFTLWRALQPHVLEVPPTAIESVLAATTFATLSIAAADRPTATRLLAQLEPFAHQHIVTTAFAPYDGPVSLVLGKLALFLGDRPRAAGWLDDARQRSEAMNAPFYSAESQRTADALRPRTGPLSPREAEVALLLGEGRTNREIAGELFLSERTVEQHVSSILRKLDLPNRSAVAAWMTRTQRG